jgi:hypothetical protein
VRAKIATMSAIQPASYPVTAMARLAARRRIAMVGAVVTNKSPNEQDGG